MCGGGGGVYMTRGKNGIKQRVCILTSWLGNRYRSLLLYTQIAAGVLLLKSKVRVCKTTQGASYCTIPKFFEWPENVAVCNEIPTFRAVRSIASMWHETKALLYVKCESRSRLALQNVTQDFCERPAKAPRFQNLLSNLVPTN